jgi:hypothetical protein
MLIELRGSRYNLKILAENEEMLGLVLLSLSNI